MHYDNVVKDIDIIYTFITWKCSKRCHAFMMPGVSRILASFLISNPLDHRSTDFMIRWGILGGCLDCKVTHVQLCLHECVCSDETGHLTLRLNHYLVGQIGSAHFLWDVPCWREWAAGHWCDMVEEGGHMSFIWSSAAQPPIHQCIHSQAILSPLGACVCA